MDTVDIAGNFRKSIKNYTFLQILLGIINIGHYICLTEFYAWKLYQSSSTCLLLVLKQIKISITTVTLSVVYNGNNNGQNIDHCEAPHVVRCLEGNAFG